MLLASAPAAGADRDPAIRVHVRPADEAAAGVGESVRDVKKVLLEGRHRSRLLESTLAEAEVVIVLSHRQTGLPPVHSRGSDFEASRNVYTLSGTVIDVRREPRPLVGRGIVWSKAADDLVRGVEAYAREQEHALLRRRRDWPKVGFEFEPLTKERERELGVKGGSVVVTAVALEGGVRVADVLHKAGGRKLENAGDLARLIYTSPPETAMPLELTRAGARRTVDLKLP